MLRTSKVPGRRHVRWVLPAVMISAVLVIASCTSTGSPSPSAGTGSTPAAQFCKDMKITFFPGGTPGGGFETVVYNGAKAAEAAFGPTMTYQWSDWDPLKMTTQFQEAVATKPDGIAIMGHPGDDAFDPLIDDARSQGILVTVMNTELPKAEAKYASAGTGYVGAVLHDAGAALATEAINRGGLKSGDKVFVWGLKAQPGRGERTLGVTDTLEKAGINVVYLEIDDATNADPSAGVAAFTGMASANPDLKAIFIDHGNVTSTIPTYMKAANLAPGSIYRRRVRCLGSDRAGCQGRIHPTGHRPAAVPPGLPGRSAAVPVAPVRFQWTVREHRWWLHRQVERRRHRPARRAADQVT